MSPTATATSGTPQCPLSAHMGHSRLQCRRMVTSLSPSFQLDLTLLSHRNAFSYTYSLHCLFLYQFLRVIAMALVWQYGHKSRYPAWKGLSWGMVSDFSFFTLLFSSLISTIICHSCISCFFIVVGTSTWWSILCVHMAFLL